MHALFHSGLSHHKSNMVSQYLTVFSASVVCFGTILSWASLLFTSTMSEDPPRDNSDAETHGNSELANSSVSSKEAMGILGSALADHCRWCLASSRLSTNPNKKSTSSWPWRSACQFWTSDCTAKSVWWWWSARQLPNPFHEGRGFSVPFMATNQAQPQLLLPYSTWSHNQYMYMYGPGAWPDPPPPQLSFPFDTLGSASVRAEGTEFPTLILIF